MLLKNMREKLLARNGSIKLLKNYSDETQCTGTGTGNKEEGSLQISQSQEYRLNNSQEYKLADSQDNIRESQQSQQNNNSISAEYSLPQTRTRQRANRITPYEQQHLLIAKLKEDTQEVRKSLEKT